MDNDTLTEILNKVNEIAEYAVENELNILRRKCSELTDMLENVKTKKRFLIKKG